MSSSSDYTTDYIDKLIDYLHSPEIQKGQVGRLAAVTGKLSSLGSNIFTKFSRLGNLVLNGDHTWYNEAKARQLLLDYLNNPACRKELAPQHAKIMAIYERLKHLSHGKGTWADGIDRELLDASYREESEEELSNFHELDQMLLENVLIPDPLDIALPDSAQNSPRLTALDPQAEAHRFARQQNSQIPSTRQLFHIHADEFGKSSELEGSQSLEAVNYLSSYLRSANALPDLCEELDNALSPAKIPEPQQNSSSITSFLTERTSDPRLQQFKELGQQNIEEAFRQQKPILIMGGWTNRPAGHAIYYEVIPVSATKASFRLYNTGAGVSQHPHGRIGGETRYQAFLEWNGIDRERLQSGYFLEALFELSSYAKNPKTMASTQYQESDVYEGLRGLLNPTKEISASTPLDHRLMMPQQRSGICAWRSLMAFLRTKMPLNDYLRFKCDIKLQSLLDFVGGLKAEMAPADLPLKWRLVKKSHQKLCRTIVHLYQKKLIGEAYVEEAQQLLKPISEWIHENASCRFQRAVEPIKANYSVAPVLLVESSAFAIPLNQTIANPGAEELALQPYHQITERFVQIDLSTPQSVGAGLGAAVVVAEDGWSLCEDRPLHYGVMNMITSLELSDQFWQEAIGRDSGRAEAMIIHLGKLSQLFLKSCFTVPDAHLILPEKSFVLQKILHLQEKICRLGHPSNRLKNLTLNHYTKDTLRHFQDPARQHQVLEIGQARELEKEVIIDKTQNFAAPQRLHNTLGFELIFSSQKANYKVMPLFADLIREQCPEVIEQITRSDPSFTNKAKYAQDAEIYVSSHLPEWVKAMRDASMAFQHIEKSYVGPLTLLRRDRDIEPSYVMRQDHEAGEEVIKVSFEFTNVGTTLLQNPSVKKQESLRFLTQYQEFKSKAMGLLVQYYSKKIEKGLLVTSDWRALIEMGDEELREDARLLLKNELALIELLEYYTKHPEKLRDTDYQTFFQLALFDNGLLEKSLKVPGIADRLVRFVEKNYTQFYEEDDLSTAIFLLKMARQIDSFCPGKEFFHNTSLKLHQLLRRPEIEPDLKCLIYSELLALLGNQTTLNDQEIVLMLSGRIFLEENKLQSRYQIDPYVTNQVEKAFEKHKEAIAVRLSAGNPNAFLLNQVASLAADRPWTMTGLEGAYPRFSTVEGDLIYLPLLSKLIRPNRQTLLPIGIRQHPTFKKLFPKIDQGIFVLAVFSPSEMSEDKKL